LKKKGMWGKGRVMEKVEWTKVNYNHSGDTSKNPSEYWLTNNERQDYKISTMCNVCGAFMGGGKVNKGD
jgi:hypothetical protein